MAGGESATSLAPGFRFHPTDEELVRYYLKRKLSNRAFRFDPISVIDIYKSEPWDLPAKSKLKSRDLEWYFFSALDRKYGNGSKTNRATEKGYWKTTGKDRPIHSNSQIVGMKKTLVYHKGRAPRGERSNWVMHEYRLVEEKLKKAGLEQDAFVLCRIFQKSGTGPKNGEQYGAPFVEEEWDDDEVAVLPCEELVVYDEAAPSDDAFVETNDLEQNFGSGDGSNYMEPCSNFGKDDQKPIIARGKAMMGNLPADKCLLDLPGQYEMDAEAIRNGYIAESGNSVNGVDMNNLIDVPYLDANDNLPVSEGFFLEANDLSNPVDPASGGEFTGFDIDEYLNFFDAVDENMAFDPSEIMGTENVDSDQSPQTQEDLNGETEEMLMASQKLLEGSDNAEVSSLKQKPNATEFESDMKNPYIKQVSHSLASIPAPPAFASEFPIKDSALQLNAAQASSSVHVTTGLIRIENMSLSGSGMDWSLGKNGNVSIIISFDLLQDDVGPASLLLFSRLFSGKTGSVMSRGWLFYMLFWVLMFAVSFKTATCVYASLGPGSNFPWG
uniref:NAC domain-containing protein 78-like isoform X1 n=1 Tax=Rhizophora mucronata TaxID=61149 RepID=A0A2P2L9Z2_RHIMU